MREGEALPIGRPIRRHRWVRVLVLALLALVGVWLGMQRNVKYYTISSGSMEPTLQVGKRVAVDTHARAPRVGEIVAFHAPEGAVPIVPVCGASDEGAGHHMACDVPTPEESRSTFVKRVAAGPGQQIAIANGRAVLNGTGQHEPYIAPCDDDTTCSFPTPVKVPADDYFVLGDNRASSDDSRFWGPVPASWIIGTVVHCSLLGTLCHPLR